MRTKSLVSLMRTDMPNDCHDFWDELECTPIKIANRKTHTARKLVIATSTILAVAICMFLVIFNFGIIKNFFSNHTEPPIIITADEKDEFIGTDDFEEVTEISDRIAPLLTEAIKTAPETALFRTMVNDPSFYQYLNSYEQDGYKYIDFKKGDLKDRFEPDEYYTKMREIEYNARMDFFEHITNKYNIEDAEKPVDSSEYSMNEYHFIANLSIEQINMLSESGCILRLALPYENTDIHDASQKNVITNKLSAKLTTTDRIEVQIYLKIDTTSSAPTFNADYYIDTIQLLTHEQLNDAFVSSYLDDFIKDHSLNVLKKESGLYIAPHQQNENMLIDLNYYGCSANIIVELTKDEIYEIAKDERVRVIAPNEYEEIIGSDE